MKLDVSEPQNFIAYSTYLGGNNGDAAFSLAIDKNRNLYIGGYTYSANFPVTAGAYDRTFGKVYDAFVVKIATTGAPPAYSTYLGGSSSEYVRGIAVDGNGSAYVTGRTFSPEFPFTPGAFDTTYNGAVDAFAVKLNPAGSALAYSTFLGGSSTDEGRGIAISPNGATVYVAGLTSSANFPTTPNAYDRSYAGNTCGADPASHPCYDVFVAKFTPTGGAGRVTRVFNPIARIYSSPPCDAYELNNERRNNPHELAVSFAIRARLCRNDEEDNYYFDLARNAAPTITVDLPPALRGKTSIWIYDQDNLDNEICGYGDTQPLARITISNCGNRAPGRYIVRLYTDNSNTVYDNVGLYMLRVTT
jgi:hypothetical protein